MTEGDASTFAATDPRTGQTAGPTFRDATSAEVVRTVEDAADAFPVLRNASSGERADLLRSAADAIEALGHELIRTAERETGLGEGRLHSERARTCGQLRFFADLLDEGSYVEAIIDTAEPNAEPPQPDLRRMLVPLGPVAVFGASNFPLAFGVPGGDTASALAAGCPVVCKAHPAHPHTAELCARAIGDAVVDRGLPAGAFGLVQGVTNRVGEQLVTEPRIRAVGFTGSLRGGRALYDLAADRPDPIPVYAEMGSLNPVFVTEGALASRGDEIADGFVTSMNLGTGQFCTKPGLVVVPAGDRGDRFVASLADAIDELDADPMLTPRLRASLLERVEQTMALDGVTVLARGSGRDRDGVRHEPLLLSVTAEDLSTTPELLEEHFGPVSIVVRCDGRSDVREVAERLPGGLTATLHADPAEHGEIDQLVSMLRERVGRLVFDGFPTGVAVTHAMQHGGPYPATTAPGHTSVGAAAIRRFLRPVVYQDAPPGLLPEELRDHNPSRILRQVDGRWTREPVT